MIKPNDSNTHKYDIITPHQCPMHVLPYVWKLLNNYYIGQLAKPWNKWPLCFTSLDIIIDLTIDNFTDINCLMSAIHTWHVKEHHHVLVRNTFVRCLPWLLSPQVLFGLVQNIYCLLEIFDFHWSVSVGMRCMFCSYK